MVNRFDYYYGIEAEQFSFYRVPKILFKEQRFKNLSSDAKLLYGLMLDRMSLSVKNKWVDERNRVYIYYTTESIMDDLGCAREKCSKVVAELDSKKGIGLIEKKRQGLGKPDIIYVKNFMSLLNEGDDHFWDGYENPEIRKSNFQEFENRIFENSISKTTEVGNSNSNNTEYSDTEINKSNPITSDDTIECPGLDTISDVNVYENMIKDNIGYEDLLQVYPQEANTIQGIYELVLETLLCKNESMVISSNTYPLALVKSKFMKLRYRHIAYVLECMKKNTSDIKNIKKYLLASLFNSTSTIDSFYRSRVNHDMPQFATG